MNDRRKYPDRPYVGVGAVIVKDGKVLLVKRKYEPLAGQWSLPGGAVEVGETLEACLVREMLEELAAKEAFGRAAEPWEVANVIVFLASDYASYLTGEVVSVSAQHP